MKQTVLIVHNYYRISGGEDTVVSAEEKLLRDNGHKVVLYTRDNKELDDMSVFSKLLLPIRTIYNKQTVRDICRIIREEGIDVVHVHNTLNLISPSVYYAAISCNVPVVQTIHNYRLICPGATLYRDGSICEDCLRKGIRCAIRHKCYRKSFLETLCCTLILQYHRMRRVYGKINYICLTEFGKKKLLEINTPQDEMIQPGKVYVKPNFMWGSTTNIQSGNDRGGYLFAGRLDETKGIMELLKAWNPDMQDLAICGEGPLEDKVTEYISEHKLDNVHFLGKLPHEDVIELLSCSGALILPTRWYEGFPMTIVESFSVGTPVIGPKMGNVGEIISDGINGILYEGDLPENIKAAVDRFEKSELMCDNARRTYEENYTPQRNYDALMDIYKAIC